MSVQASDFVTDSTLQGRAQSQYLTFRLNNETYGVDILRIQEIRGWTPVTQVPKTPSYIEGVLNLRGTIVPIMDLRRRFELNNQENTRTTVVIVVAVKRDDRESILGMVVDAVSDVVDIKQESVRETPDFGKEVRIEFLKGMSTTEENVVMLLDIDKLLSVAELRAIENMSVDEDVAEAEKEIEG